MPWGNNPNNAGSGDLLLTGNNNYLSSIQNQVNQLGGIASSLAQSYSTLSPIWSSNRANAAAIGNSGYTQDQPLSIAVPAQPTTGSVPPQIEKKTDWMPYILVGAALLVVVLVVKG